MDKTDTKVQTTSTVQGAPIPVGDNDIQGSNGPYQADNSRPTYNVASDSLPPGTEGRTVDASLYVNITPQLARDIAPVLETQVASLLAADERLVALREVGVEYPPHADPSKSSVERYEDQGLMRKLLEILHPDRLENVNYKGQHVKASKASAAIKADKAEDKPKVETKPKADPLDHVKNLTS